MKHEITEQQFLERVVPIWDHMTERLERLRDEMVSLNGIQRRGLRAVPIINGASIKISVSAGQLGGYSIRETSGTGVATVRFHDGVDAGGDILMPIQLAAGESARDWLMPHGIAFVNGLFCEVVAGTIEGAVFIGPAGS